MKYACHCLKARRKHFSSSLCFSSHIRSAKNKGRFFVPTGSFKKMDPSEYIPILTFKAGNTPSSVLLHKNDTVVDVVTYAGYSAHSGRVKIIVDESDWALNKVSAPLRLSLAAISEGHLQDPSIFMAPEQVRIKVLLEYLTLRGLNQENNGKKVCLFDVYRSISRTVHQPPTFEYDLDKNFASMNYLVHPRIPFCNIHAGSLDVPIFIYPAPPEMQPLLEDGLTASDLLSAMYKAPFSSQTTYEVGSILYPFLRQTLFHLFSAAACTQHNRKTIFPSKMNCYSGGHLVNKADSIFKELIYHSPAHAFGTIQPPESFRHCRLFSLQKSLVDVSPIFLKLPEIDECKTMDGNFPGFVNTEGSDPKVFLCKSDSAFGRCLHQPLGEVYMKLQHHFTSFHQQYVIQKPYGLLYEKFLHEFWEYAAFYSIPFHERNAFIESETINDHNMSKDISSHTYKDFNPVVKDIYLDKELYIVRDIFLISHQNRGGCCLKAAPQSSDIPHPNGYRPIDLSDDENYYLFTKKEQIGTTAKQGLYQYKIGLDGSEQLFTGPFNNPKLNDYSKFISLMDAKDPRIDFRKCPDCSQCKHLKTFYCSQFRRHQVPVVLKNQNKAPVVRVETSHCSFFFRRKNHSEFQSNSTLITDIIHTISQLYLLTSLSTTKLDYYAKRCHALFCLNKDPSIFSNSPCKHDYLLSQFKNLHEIFLFSESLNDEFRALEVLRISCKFSLDSILAKEKAARQCIHLEMDLRTLTDTLYELSFFHHLLFFNALFDAESSLLEQIVRITNSAFRYCMSLFFANEEGEHFTNAHPNSLVEYRQLIDLLKGTFYSTESQYNQLYTFLQTCAREHVCNPLFAAFLLSSHKTHLNLTDAELSLLTQLESVSPDYLLMFTIRQSPGTYPAHCKHRLGLDSPLFHNYYHLFRNYLLQYNFSSPELREAQREADLQKRLSSFLDFLKQSQFSSVIHIHELVMSPSFAEIFYYQSYSLCAC